MGDVFSNVIGGRFLERQARRYRADTSKPVGRPAFFKTHGCAHGTFTIEPDLPAELRVGVFAGGPYDAVIRFSSDPAKDSSDLVGNTVGLAIELSGVPGPKLLEGSTSSGTHDFVLQNSDVFPAAGAERLMELMEIALEGDAETYMGHHPEIGRIMAGMKKVEHSVLWAEYSSTTPYRFGREPERFVKYSARIGRKTGGPAIAPERRDDHYPRTDLLRRLGRAGSTLDFFVQFFVDAKTTPLDDVTVPWDPQRSEPVRVATLRIPKQTIDFDEPTAFDHLSFNAWHALADHEPVGSLNRARRIAYVLSADARRRMNEEPIAEPDEAV